MAWYSGIVNLGNVITGTVKTIFSPITEWQKRKTEKVKLTHNMEMADLKFRTGLISGRESHNQKWEIEALKVKKRSPMQWISFIVLGLPFIIAWFNPALVATYFAVSIKVIPEWYIKLFVSILGVVWGIAQLKNVSAGVNEALLSRKAANIEFERIKKQPTFNNIVENIEDKVELTIEEIRDKYPEIYKEIKEEPK